MKPSAQQKQERLTALHELEVDGDERYAALTARDPRFDGVFFVGVSTTGIYCRPVCPARTPKRSSCAFFEHHAAAEAAGFRPCLRCRPELAPGCAPIDQRSRTAARIAQRVRAGALDRGRRAEDLAAELGWSDRQLRRVVQAEFGVTLGELVTTHRLLLAKQLLTETSLPVVEVAPACGFGSLRRFQDVFRTRYGMTPTQVRGSGNQATTSASLKLRLDYRPPFALDELMAFLSGHAVPGVECVRDSKYMRSVGIGKHRGWVCVSSSAKAGRLQAEISMSLAPVLAEVLAGLRRLFDLDADSQCIDAHLGRGTELAEDVSRTPGLRVPGAFDAFEVAWRGILGQQVSVAGANTLAGRIVQRLGQPIETPFAEITHLSPLMDRFVASDLGDLGLMPSRLATLVAFTEAVRHSPEWLEPLPEETTAVRSLLGIRGIGPWTASYLALRCHRDPDAFMEGDLAARRVIEGNPSDLELAKRSLAWKPWRAYALMHLWNRNARKQEATPQ